MSCQELANKTCRTESKNWEGFSGTASKNWKVFRKCVCVCQDLCLHMSRTFCMWVLCETHVRHMMHVKWWSGTHLNIVTTAKKVQTNLFETSSIVPHGCSCMKVFLGDDSIFEDTLYDYLMLSGQKIVKCLQSCWKIKLSIQTLMQTTLYIVQTTLQTALYIMQTTLYIMQTTLCHNANYIMP